MRETLKSMSQQASIDFCKAGSKEEDHPACRQEEQESRKYNIKLDQLSRNLEELASKGHFSPAAGLKQRVSTFSQANANQSLPLPKAPNQSLQRYELQTEHYAGNQSSNSHFPASKS